MYLNQLSNEQKELFLDLCIHAAESNAEITDKEKNYIKQYCEEMQIAEVRFKAEMPLEQAIDKMIAVSNQRELRIVLIELTALVMCDGHYDDFEKNFIKKIAIAANITDDDKLKMQESISDLFNVYNKIETILG